MAGTSDLPRPHDPLAAPVGDARPRRFALIGPGRAGGALAGALESVGWQRVATYGRGDDPRHAAAGVDLVVVAVPDRAIAEAAAAVEPADEAVIVHLAGSLGVDVLGAHPHRGGIHPLVALADPAAGARRLAAGAWFAVGGSTERARTLLDAVVADLGGHAVHVADADRTRYHAAACIASNHLVALLGQVERVAASVGVPVEAFADLVAGTLDNVAAHGPAAALTGPVQRGDWATVARHVAALDPAERPAYVALAESAARLVPDRDVPDGIFAVAEPEPDGRTPPAGAGDAATTSEAGQDRSADAPRSTSTPTA